MRRPSIISVAAFDFCQRKNIFVFLKIGIAFSKRMWYNILVEQKSYLWRDIEVGTFASAAGGR